jgi:hypothetical protein
MKKDKNGARPQFQPERWTRHLQNGARPHFQKKGIKKEGAFFGALTIYLSHYK